MTRNFAAIVSVCLASMVLMGQSSPPASPPRQSTIVLTRGGVTTTVTIPTPSQPARAPSPAPNSAADDFKGNVWIPLTGMDRQIFPSTILTMATSKKQFAAIGIKLRNMSAGTKVRVTVSCDSLMEPIDEEQTLGRAAPIVNLPLNVKWKFDALTHVRQQAPMSFTYRVWIDGADTGEKVDTVVVHPINVCMFGYRDSTGEMKHMLPLFAGYVNENSPNLDKFLKEALATGVVRQFDGYRGGDPKQVQLQVLAVWHTLQRRGVKYSNIADKPKDSAIVWAQYVRFPSESLENAQANCVDGTVAIASILQKIGIDTALIGTPDHMYLAYYSKAGKQAMQVLETTILGQVDVNPKVPMDMTDGRWQVHPSGASFLGALKTGAEEYKELMESSKKVRQDPNRDSHEYIGSFIPVDDARRMGYMPIPQIGDKP